jgi:hypothetical protein
MTLPVALHGRTLPHDKQNDVRKPDKARATQRLRELAQAESKRQICTRIARRREGLARNGPAITP